MRALSGQDAASTVSSTSNPTQSPVHSNQKPVLISRSRSCHGSQPSSSADLPQHFEGQHQSGQGVESSELPPFYLNGQPIPDSSLTVGSHEPIAESDNMKLTNGRRDGRTAEITPNNFERSGNLLQSLTNGHDSQFMKVHDYRFVSQPNGLTTPVDPENEKRVTLGSSQSGMKMQKSSNKCGTTRRTRRKADLSQETSPRREDNEEFIVTAASAAQSSRQTFTRRVSIAGGVVIGSSGSTSLGSAYGGVVAMQNSNNSFSRQQQQMVKHQPKMT
ncbi:hypothetical protein AB6A40_009611 [Gnathostoma spinigerum]|uniref:Uncharacterized protein n=1 Tax=Gnathostoma spinigerum TaxID=75299 RepID=A0ABD6EUW9_9BILA